MLDFYTLRHAPDAIAPDGSEIRPLASTERASMVHCTLPPGGVSLAVRHRTVEEIWFFLEGSGEVWRKRGDEETVRAVGLGISLTIPPGAEFQFRNTGELPLQFIIASMPPWPGFDEAVLAPGFWPAGDNPRAIRTVAP